MVLPPAPYVFNDDRPGYHASWSWAEGAQNDIFLPAVKAKRSTGPLAQRIAVAARKASINSEASGKVQRRDGRKGVAAAAGKMICSHTLELPCEQLPAFLEQLEDSSLLDGMMVGQGV